MMKGRLKAVLWWSAMGICIGGAVWAAIFMYQDYRRKEEGRQAYEVLRQSVQTPDPVPLSPQPEEGKGKTDSGQTADDGEIPVDFTDLITRYPELLGWICSEGTPIDYPVMQHSDNEYYLTHLYDGTRNASGSIFLNASSDPELQDDVTVLYGHHMRDQSMFASLSGYKDQSYYEAHPDLMYYRSGKAWRLEVLAGMIAHGETEQIPLNFRDHQERESFIQHFYEASTFQSGITVEQTDSFMVLVTCSYEFHEARYALLVRILD